jgi:hypothetical protein
METRVKLVYFYFAAMLLIAFVSSLGSLRNFAFLFSVVIVSGLISLAVQQIHKHGKSRWWIGVLAAIALSIFIVLTIMPGPFLYPLIPWIEN